MKRLVLQSLRYEPLRRAALGMVRGLWALTQGEAALAVETFVRSRMTIVSEPQEILIRPDRMIFEIDARGWTAGDCDDAAMLAAALLVILGIPARFRATGVKPDGGYEHVYIEARLGGLGRETEWFPIDPTSMTRPEARSEDMILEI